MGINTNREIKKSRNEMEQMSWDKVYEVLTRLNLTLNPVSSSLERVTAIQGNASYALSYTDGNLTQFDKTVSGTTYRKTFTWSGGNLTAITTWSQV